MKKGNRVGIILFSLCLAFISLFVLSNNMAKASDYDGNDGVNFGNAAAVLVTDTDEVTWSANGMSDQSNWEIEYTAYVIEGGYASLFIYTDDGMFEASSDANYVIHSYSGSDPSSGSINGQYEIKIYEGTFTIVVVDVELINGTYTYSWVCQLTLTVEVSTSAPVWYTANVSSIKAGASVYVQLTSTAPIYNYSSSTFYKYGWSTSSTTNPSTWLTTFSSRTSTKISFNATAPSPTTNTTYYLWIYNRGEDTSGNVSTFSGKTPYYQGTAYNSYVKYQYTITATDTTPPVVRADSSSGTIISAGSTTNYPASSKTFYFSDAGSGYSYASFVIYDGNNKTTTTTNSSYTFTTINVNIMVAVYDKAGNSTHFEFYLMPNKPTISCNGTEVSYTSTNYFSSCTLSFASPSNSSAQNLTKYIIIDETADTSTSKSLNVYSYSYGSLSEGTYIVSIYDNADHIVETEIIVDATAPTYTSYTGGSSSWVYSATLTIKGASDTGSGLASTPYCFTTSSSSSGCSWTSSSTLSITSTTNTYYYAFIRDHIGNVKSAGSQQVKVDRTAPTYTSYTGGSSSWVYSATLTIKGASDTGSGLASTPYCFTTSSSSSSCGWTSSSTLSITSTTNTYYYAFIRDAVGNVKSAGSQQVKVDRTAPTYTSYTGGSSSWVYSATLTIAGASDTGSGLASTPYCFTTSSSSSGCGWTSSSTLSITSTTNTYYYAFIRDAVGNVKSAGSQQVKVDRTAPVVKNVTVTNSSNGNWTNGSVTITLSGASDDHSGFSKYQYSYDKSTWNNDWSSVSTTSTTGVWSAENNKTVYFRVMDNVGNTALVDTITYVKIDKTAPVKTNVTVTNSSNGNWTNQGVTITLSGASDALSGFAKYQYSYDKSTWNNDWGGSSTADKTTGSWSAQRNNIVYFRVVDNAGNTALIDQTTYIRIDTTAPTYTSYTGGGDAWATSTTLSINGAADASSGLASSPYCFVSSSSTTAPGYSSCSWGSSATKSITSANNSYYHAYIKDAAGNVKYAGYKLVKADPTAPTYTSYTGGSDAWATSRTLSINGASDAGSGLASSPYCFTTSSSSSGCGWTSASTLSITTTTDTYYYAFIKDAVGNIKSAGNQRVRVDRTAPDASKFAVTNSSNGNWTNQNVTLTLSGATDTGSGFARYQYSYDKTNWYNDWSGTATATSTIGNWGGEYNTIVYFRVVDNVGNTTLSDKTTYIKIDKSAPSVSSYTGGSDAWVYTANLSVKASDSRSGLASSPYCFVTNSSTTAPGTTNCAWTSASTLSITTQTDTYYHVYVKDAVGNIAHAGSQRVRVDRTAPVVNNATVTNSSNGNWTNGSVTITLKGATDAHSGFSKYEYSYDKSTWKSDWGGAYKIDDTHGTWSAEANTIVYFRVVDAVGNATILPTTTYLRIDKTAPVVSGVTITNSSNGNWTNQGVTITLSGATDAGSGFAKYQYSYDKTNWYNDWSAGATASKTAGVWSAERNNTVYFRVLDNVGNISNISNYTYIKIDRTAPVMREGSTSGTRLVAGGTINYIVGNSKEFYFIDELGTYKSGFSKANFNYEGAAASAKYDTTSSSMKLSSTYKYIITVYDAAGNSSVYYIKLGAAANTVATDAVLATATLSNGKITFTKSGSNNIQDLYKNGSVTYFIGKYGNYTTADLLNAGFTNYGSTVSASTFFASSWTTPQGLVGNVELYVRLSGTNLTTIFAKSGSINISSSTATSSKTFALEVETETPIEEVSTKPVALSTSNIVIKENIRKPNYMLFVSMIFISSLLALEVIIIRKHKKAHN